MEDVGQVRFGWKLGVVTLEGESDQLECEDEEDGVGVRGRLGESQPGGESEEGQVGETPEEGELVGARGRAAGEDEDSASDLEEEVEDVRSGHQQADYNASSGRDESETFSPSDQT